MDRQIWLPLNEYAAKFKVSISTLRRRIRSNEIEHRFHSGKYWLKNQPVSKYINSYMELDEQAKSTSVKAAPVEEAVQDRTETPPNITVETQPAHDARIGEFIDSANKVMNELKGAYVAVLHEKEAQIMQLKEEVTNLKTLIKILESENDRLASNLNEAAPIDSWLDKNFE